MGRRRAVVALALAVAIGCGSFDADLGTSSTSSSSSSSGSSASSTGGEQDASSSSSSSSSSGDAGGCLDCTGTLFCDAFDRPKTEGTGWSLAGVTQESDKLQLDGERCDRHLAADVGSSGGTTRMLTRVVNMGDSKVIEVALVLTLDAQIAEFRESGVSDIVALSTTPFATGAPRVSLAVTKVEGFALLGGSADQEATAILIPKLKTRLVWTVNFALGAVTLLMNGDTIIDEQPITAVVAMGSAPPQLQLSIGVASNAGATDAVKMEADDVRVTLK